MTGGIVYRCYDRYGDLIYVGTSIYSAEQRVMEHRGVHRRTGRSGWVTDCVDVFTDVYPKWQQAVAAERALIAALNPIGNIAHRTVAA